MCHCLFGLAFFFLHLLRGLKMNEFNLIDKNLTNDQIRELYDSHLNMTLQELSNLTGLSINALKKIILEN